MTGDSPSRDIAGRYRLREALSKRPVGRWFRAHDSEVEVEVGLLMVNPELLPDEDSQNRFIGAVVEMRDINHRHLLKLYDVGREGGSVYLTTQLSQPIRALYKAEGVLDYVNSVADGLDAVHRAGQTHGRLTPSDVCEVQGLFKVAGAGLYSEIPPALAMRVWRTLSCFWAPEVVRGERPTPVADVYSLAAIAAVLLNNGKASDPHRALEELRQENPSVHDALAPALSVTPDDRPASPSLLVNRLANALDDDEVDEAPTAYFVKSDTDDGDTGMIDERTVLDVHIPEEIARARPMSSVVTVELEPSRPAAEAGRGPSPQGKRKSTKDMNAKAHERTVVEATALPPGVKASSKSVPAMVAMGPPVGPASARKQPLGKKTGEQAVPPRGGKVNDSTERMQATGGQGQEQVTSKAPPVVTSQSWASRSKIGPAARSSQPIQQAPVKASRPLVARPADAGDASERAATTPRFDGPAKPAGERPRRVPRQTGDAADGESAYERAKTARKAPGRASQAALSAPSATASAAPSKPLAVPGSVPALPPSAAPAQAQAPVPDSAPAAAPPLAASPPPAQAPAELGHYAPPAGRPAPRGNNMTWLYVVIAAVVSASLAIFVAMALFGQ